jgi:hypothetical protein
MGVRISWLFGAFGHALLQPGRGRLGLRQPQQVFLAGPQPVVDRAAHVQQGRALEGGELARHRVDHAQGTQVLVVQPDWHAGVEAQVGRAGDQRVVCEALVLRGVGHHQQVVTDDGPVAERDLARHVGGDVGVGL